MTNKSIPYELLELYELAGFAVAWIKAARERGLGDKLLNNPTENDIAVAVACFKQAARETGVLIRPQDTGAITAMLDGLLREEEQ